jgi:hypothetical protein
MVGRKFGSAIVEDIRQMTGHRLERDLLDGKLEVPPTLLPKEESSIRSEPAELLTLTRR